MKSGCSVLIAAASLLVLSGVSRAIENCHDYTRYNVMRYQGWETYRLPDFRDNANNSWDPGKLVNWLTNTAKYERVWGPAVVSHGNPIPGLRRGDVLLVWPAHSGFIVEAGPIIDHGLQVFPGKAPGAHVYTPLRYSFEFLPPTICPQRQPTERDRGPDRGCGGFRPEDKANPLSKLVPICCGHFPGDDWGTFLDRQSDWQGTQFLVYREKDTDKDGVPDWKDKCPNTAPPLRAKVDQATGCAWEELDADGDGVKNGEDKCPNTAPTDRPVEMVKPERKGCGPCQLDDDGDGVANCKDKCHSTPRGEPVDENGCSFRQQIRLTIDADDPVEVRGVARFTANIDHRSEAALQSMPGWTYEWLVEGQPSSNRSSTLRGRVPENYSKSTLTATVRLVITAQGQRITLADVSKTVQVKKPQSQCGGKQWKLDVPNNKPEKKMTGATSPNCHYVIDADGTVSDWSDKADGVDAVWCYAKWRCGEHGQPWQQLRINGQGMADLAGRTIDYQSSHRYQIRVKGTGQPFEFYSSDAMAGSWQDNKGSFAVTVTEVAPQ